MESGVDIVKMLAGTVVGFGFVGLVMWIADSLATYFCNDIDDDFFGL